MSETKTCTICKQEKLLKEYWYLSSRGRYDYRCKACDQKRNTANKRAAMRDMPFRTAHKRKQSKARINSIDYDLNPEYLELLWKRQSGKCAVLGVDLDLHGPNRHDHKATIDRIIPSLGYTQGNIKWVSWLANRIKNDCTDPEVFIKVAEYVRNCNDIEEPEFDFSFPD